MGCVTSLDNVTSLPLSVEYCTKSRKTGENAYKITKDHIRQLQVCYSCLGKIKSDILIVHDFSSCNSYCEICYTLKSVCTDCHLAGHNSYHPQLRRCDVCTLESKKCEKCTIFIVTSDCEEGNKQMFLKMKEQISNGEIDPNLSLISPLPHLGKNMKASFSNWYLKLDDERSNLSFLYTLRNSSDKEKMQIMKKLLPKNYVRNKDRQDPISVLKLSQPKLTEYIEKIGYVGHTVIPETIKFTNKDKVGMYPCPISITVD